jgi:chemotaxis protein MotB
LSDNQHPEIVIIKRHGSHEDGHHGGAWKIAFADFMTALMALFLVLWLISSTSDKTKLSLARYFNPVKLVEMTPMQKGIQDPNEKEVVSGESNIASASQAEKKRGEGSSPTKPMRDPVPNARLAKYSEDALFRDPYAVLSEIAENATTAISNAHGGSASSARRQIEEESYNDPFTTVPRVPEFAVRPDPEKAQNHATESEPSTPRVSVAPTVAVPSTKVDHNPTVLPPSTSVERSKLPQTNEEEARELRSDIDDALQKETKAKAKTIPHIDVESTKEGILISLTDEYNYSMFAVGSSEPQARTIQVIGKIAQLLKARPGAIVIRGHTDGRPYKTGLYDNWRLSTSRAHMAQYMLVRGGLDERRIERVEGYADHRLKITSDPDAAENRRIEILLRRGDR